MPTAEQSSRRRVRASSRQATTRAVGSSATCTTGRNNGSSRLALPFEGPRARVRLGPTSCAPGGAKVRVGSDGLRAEVSDVAEGLKTAVDRLRELSQGIHPAELTAGGLSPALKALGRRSAVRVELDVPFEDRLPDQVEVAAYYTVSEALTNASKHANATRVWVSLTIEDDVLLLSIRDDGVGGADPRRGSGLTGL